MKRTKPSLLARSSIVWQLHALMIWPGFAIGYVEKVSHFRASLEIPEATRVSYCQYNVQRSTELHVTSDQRSCPFIAC
jgi:hypothetical protein